MDFYYILFFGTLACALFEYGNVKVKHAVIILLCTIWTLIGGLRWQIGNDWDQYQDYFYELDSLTNIFNVQRGWSDTHLEPGFVFLNSLVHIVFGEFYYYNLIVCAFIQFTAYRLSFRFSPQYPIIFFICYNLMAYNLTPVRAGLSMAICWWAYCAIQRRNLKQFIIIVFCAASIHAQALVLLPAYWIGKIRLKFRYILIIMFTAIALGNIFKDYFFILAGMMGGDIADRASQYSDFTADYMLSKQLQIINYLVPIFFLCLYEYTQKKLNKKDDLWWNCMIYGYTIYNLIKFIFTGNAAEMARLNQVYTPFNVLLFVSAFTYFAKRAILSRLVAYLFFFVYLSWQITRITGEYFFKYSNVPYKTIFDYSTVKK